MEPSSADTNTLYDLSYLQKLTCSVQVNPDSHFPIQNLPFGIFSDSQNTKRRVGVRIGDFILDCAACADKGYFKATVSNASELFNDSVLNSFMAAGRGVWTCVRKQLFKILSVDFEYKNALPLIKCSDATMHLPARIGDVPFYTDFYASKEHATNLGIMFRGPENALMPNWLHLPVGYHGRASSVVVSGTSFPRPCGQKKPPTSDPIWSPCQLLDYELEMGCFIGTGNKIGHPISVANAKDHLFGVVLLNDWSARDIQKWEYVPLGPFNGKNFQTTISPWVVTIDALEPYRVESPKMEKPILPYLQLKEPSAYDVELTVSIQSPKMAKPSQIGLSNLRSLYWSFTQQLAHHTSTGCNFNPGDLIGTGTISGTTPESYGSLLEKSKAGKIAIQLTETESRKFLLDNDSVILEGSCFNKNVGFRIGFGQCVGTVLPAVTPHPHSS